MQPPPLSRLVDKIAETNPRLVKLFVDRSLRESLAKGLMKREDVLPLIMRDPNLYGFSNCVVSKCKDTESLD